MPIASVAHSIEIFLRSGFHCNFASTPKERKSMVHDIQHRYIPIWLAMSSVVGLNMVEDLLNCNSVTLDVRGFDHMDDRLTLDDSMPF